MVREIFLRISAGSREEISGKRPLRWEMSHSRSIDDNEGT